MMESKEWNLQTRGQLVEDLYYTCKQDGEILEELLDEYESDIKNYTTYDIHAKLMEVK